MYRRFKQFFIFTVCCCLGNDISLTATTYIVDSSADDDTPGTLRYSLIRAQTGDIIDINSGLSTITVGTTALTALPILQGVTINGNGNTISGNDTYPIFFAQSGTNAINNLNLVHGLGQGGNGSPGAGGGGGGPGVGGALFVNSDAVVNASGLNFSSNTVVGGNGGLANGLTGGGGGGGLYNSNGGITDSSASGGSGGGGVFNSSGGRASSKGGSGGGGINLSTGGRDSGGGGGGGGGGYYLSVGGDADTGGAGGGGIRSSGGGEGSDEFGAGVGCNKLRKRGSIGEEKFQKAFND